MAKGKALAIGTVVLVCAGVVLFANIMGTSRDIPENPQLVGRVKGRVWVNPNTVIFQPKTLLGWISMHEVQEGAVGTPQQGDFSDMRETDYTFYLNPFEVAVADLDKHAYIKYMWASLCNNYHMSDEEALQSLDEAQMIMENSDLTMWKAAVILRNLFPVALTEKFDLVNRAAVYTDQYGVTTEHEVTRNPVQLVNDAFETDFSTLVTPDVPYNGVYNELLGLLDDVARRPEMIPLTP